MPGVVGCLHRAQGGVGVSPADEAELRHLLRLVYREREVELIRCRGKFPYPTKIAANRNASYAHRHTRMDSYKCPVCGAWHRGSSLKGPVRSPYARERRLPRDED